MKKFVKTLKTLWKDESAQGATEYILLLVVVVAIAMMFKEKIQTAVESKLKGLSDSIGSFGSKDG